MCLQPGASGVKPGWPGRVHEESNIKACDFSYARPENLAQALAQTRVGIPAAEGAAVPDVRLMSGGQSLGPMLNLRLAEPALVIDVRRLPELRQHRVDAGRLVIGAAVTHSEIEDGALADTTHGMLASVARNIAYRAIRNRGTIGGSLAHADPAADWVNSLIALQASVHLSGAGGPRVMAISDFIRNAYQTALAPGEILTAVELPAFTAQMRWGYYKICTKVGEFASAIGAVVVDPGIGLSSLMVGAIEAKPLLLPELANVLNLPYQDARYAIVSHLTARLPQADEVFVHQHAVALARAIRQMHAR